MVERFPSVRFNADISHWYTGHEFTYGNVAEKLDRLAPVFERVRFIHGRISTSGAIQVSARQKGGPHLEHFKDIWTRCFSGFLESAEPGDILAFCPELLPDWVEFAGTRHWLNYAYVDTSGKEQSDRFCDAMTLWDIACSCFENTKYRSAAGSNTVKV